MQIENIRALNTNWYGWSILVDVYDEKISLKQ